MRLERSEAFKGRVQAALTVVPPGGVCDSRATRLTGPFLAAVLLAMAVLPASAGARSVAVAADGAIALSETFTDGAGNGARGTARLNPALAPEATFGRNGYRLDEIGEVAGSRSKRHVAFGPNGSIVEAITTNPSQPAVRTFVRRLTSNGGDDATFGTGGLLTLPVENFIATDVVALEDGRILIGGSIGSALAIVGLRSDGTLDPGWGGDGVATAARDGIDASAQALSVLGDGRVLAGGIGLVARFDADGGLDGALGNAGTVATGIEIQQVAPAGEGFFLARGTGLSGIRVERRRENGTLDPAWGTGGVFTDALAGDVDHSYDISDVLLRPGGALLVGATVVDAGSACRVVTAQPVLVAADGDSAESFPALRISDINLAPGPDGAAIAEGPDREGGCDEPSTPGLTARLARYDAAGALVASALVSPVVSPPSVAITSGPLTSPGAVTGDTAHFTFAVTPSAGDGDDVLLRCSLDDAAWSPCPADRTWRGLPEGPKTLRVQAIGINGALSEIARYDWTVRYPPPAEPTPTPTPTPPAEPTPTPTPPAEPAPTPTPGGGQTPGGDGSNGPGTTTPPSSSDAAKLRLRFGVARGGRVRVRLRSDTAGKVRLRASVTIRGKRIVIASRTVKVRRTTRSRTYVLRPTRAGRAALRRAGAKAKVRVSATFVAPRAPAKDRAAGRP